MQAEHIDLVYYAKTYGLFYLIGLSVIVLAYVFWPANKPTFDNASTRILEDEDKPWR